MESKMSVKYWYHLETIQDELISSKAVIIKNEGLLTTKSHQNINQKVLRTYTRLTESEKSRKVIKRNYQEREWIETWTRI